MERSPVLVQLTNQDLSVRLSLSSKNTKNVLVKSSTAFTSIRALGPKLTWAPKIY